MRYRGFPDEMLPRAGWIEAFLLEYPRYLAAMDMQSYGLPPSITYYRQKILRTIVNNVTIAWRNQQFSTRWSHFSMAAPKDGASCIVHRDRIPNARLGRGPVFSRQSVSALNTLVRLDGCDVPITVGISGSGEQ